MDKMSLSGRDVVIVAEYPDLIPHRTPPGRRHPDPEVRPVWKRQRGVITARHLRHHAMHRPVQQTDHLFGHLVIGDRGVEEREVVDVVQEPAVDGDLENPAARPAQADFGARMGVQDQVPRRDRTRLVASHATVFDFDSHLFVHPLS
jgi:hypothetical protein